MIPRDGLSPLYLALLCIAFVSGLVLWIVVGVHYRIAEPWDRPASNAAWVKGSLLISFVLGILTPRPRLETPTDPKATTSSRFLSVAMPICIGVAVGLGASLAMLFRSSGHNLWALGAVTMVFFGVFFGLAALLAAALRGLVQRFL